MKLKINTTTYKIKFVTGKEEPDIWGCARHTTGEILIRKDVPAQIVKTTIVHELVHAYIFAHGFCKPYSESEMLFSEEQLCDFVAMNLDTIKGLADKVYKYFVKHVNKGLVE